MCQLQAKILRFQNISQRFYLVENNFSLVYYTPTKLRLAVNTVLATYKPFNLYKRTVKHTNIPLVVKKHFSPGLGVMKFNDLAALLVCLTDLKKQRAHKDFFAFKLVNIFFRNQKQLFFSDIPTFLQNQHVINNSQLYFLRFYSNILLKVLNMLVFFKRCMLVSFFLVKKHAHA